MNKWLATWQKKTPFQRAMMAIGMAASVLAIIFAFLYLLDIYKSALSVAIALMGVSMVSQGGLYWQKDKPMAIFSILVGLFLFGITGYIFLKGV